MTPTLGYSQWASILYSKFKGRDFRIDSLAFLPDNLTSEIFKRLVVEFVNIRRSGNFSFHNKVPQKKKFFYTITN